MAAIGNLLMKAPAGVLAMTPPSPIAKNFPVVLLSPVIEKHGGNGEAELAKGKDVLIIVEFVDGSEIDNGTIDETILKTTST